MPVDESSRMLRVEPNDSTLAAEVLARAFADDPGYVWIAPDETRRARLLAFIYQRLVPELARLGSTFAATTESAGRNDRAPNAVLGVAAWWPPGKELGYVALLRAGLVKMPLQCGAQATWRVLRVLSTMERTRAALLKGQPHWVLDHLGVDPDEQGRGYGRKLLNESLERHVDPTHLPALLHTVKDRNVRLYESVGFEVRSVIEFDGPNGFLLRSMVRDAR